MPNQYYSLDNNTQQVLPQRPGRPKHESRERTTKSKSQFYVDDREASAPPPPYEEDYQPEEQKRITMQFMRETNVELSLANDILAAKNWKLNDALQAYRQFYCSSNSPVPRTGSESSAAGYQSRDMKSKPDHPQRMHRGLSKVFDYDEMDSFRRQEDIRTAITDSSGSRNINISFDNTFMIPDLTTLHRDLSDYIEQELIDFVTMNILEKTGHINWWAGRSLSRRLWPLHTTGDGNCLLHAASLAMWGLQDKFLNLRVELHKRLKSENMSGALYRRWRWQQTQGNMEMSLVFSEEEWQIEWENLLQLSAISKKYVDSDDSEDPRSVVYYEFLEEFHVYVLAQILKRPIIVFADSVLRDVDGFPLSPIPFGGIYLPLECQPSECDKTPLLLAYDRSHFTAVVTMAPSKQKSEHSSSLRDVIPLTGPQCDLLPMHFFVDPGSSVDWNNLPEDKCTMMGVIGAVQDYLEVRNIPIDQIQENSSDGSDSGSTNSLNSKDGKQKKQSNLKKVKEKIIPGNKVSKSKSAEKKLVHMISDPELEPGKELIMCAKLTIKTPKSYKKDMDKYISLTSEEFEKKKRLNLLVDPKTIPAIATKDYAKTLSVNTQNISGSISPSAVSPAGGQMCKQCTQYLGTKEQGGLCSTCYRQSEGAAQTRPCRKCGEFMGTEANFFYCSRCHKEFIEVDEEKEKSGIKSPSSNGSQKNMEEYRVAMSNSPDEIVTRHTIAGIRDREYERSSLTSQTAPHRFPANTSTESSYVTSPYDRNPQGYLKRDPDPVRPRESHKTTITLGLDPVMPQNYLHMVSAQPRTAYNKSRYEDLGSAREIPITHHQYGSTDTRAPSRRLSAGTGGGGLKQCSYCNALTSNAQRICINCRTRMNNPVGGHFAAMRAAQLTRCKRVGCNNSASSNVGLCRDCDAKEKRFYSSRNTPASNLKYSY